ncbi:hypothetical protein [Streptomyces sp. MN6]
MELARLVGLGADLVHRGPAVLAAAVADDPITTSWASKSNSAGSAGAAAGAVNSVICAAVHPAAHGGVEGLFVTVVS